MLNSQALVFGQVTSHLENLMSSRLKKKKKTEMGFIYRGLTIQPIPAETS
jgi:hypothetical protein